MTTHVTDLIEDPLLAALATHWSDVLRYADADAQRRIVDLVRRGGEDDPVDVRAELAEELLILLPAEHPLLAVIGSGLLGRDTPGRTDLTELARAFEQLRGRALAVLVPHPVSTLDEAEYEGDPTEPVDDWFDVEVRSRLLALPGLDRAPTPDEGDVAGLLLLPHPGRGWRLPAFQLGPVGRPHDVVLEVNGLLDADRDPWGVACWWVDVHAGLDRAPADLLGRGMDDLIRAAVASSLETD
jgi:hypothetical protein